MIRRKQRTDSFSSLQRAVDEETLQEGLTNSVFTSNSSLDKNYSSLDENYSSLDKNYSTLDKNYSSLNKDWSESKESARIKYQRLQEDNDGFLPAQFESPDVQVPIKAIVLASFLFLAGFAAITFGSLSLLGYLDRIPDTGPIVLLLLGLLMFIPGSYHVMIAYYAFKDEPGYSFDDIPDFN